MNDIKPTQQQFKNILSSLTLARMKPSMYFDLGELAVNNFLRGFWAACAIFGVDAVGENEILKERGWQEYIMPATMGMRKAGLNEDQITVELLTVAILTIQRKYDVDPQAIFDVHEQIRATNKQLAIRLDDESGVNVLRLIPNAYDSMKEQIIPSEKLMMSLEQDIKNLSNGKSK